MSPHSLLSLNESSLGSCFCRGAPRQALSKTLTHSRKTSFRDCWENLFFDSDSGGRIDLCVIHRSRGPTQCPHIQKTHKEHDLPHSMHIWAHRCGGHRNKICTSICHNQAPSEQTSNITPPPSLSPLSLLPSLFWPWDGLLYLWHGKESIKRNAISSSVWYAFHI